MIKLTFNTSDFKNYEDYNTLSELLKKNGLTFNRPKFLSGMFTTTDFMSIVGDSAQVIALLLTLYQMYGNSKRVNYRSDKHNEKNISFDQAISLAKKEESVGKPEESQQP